MSTAKDDGSGFPLCTNCGYPLAGDHDAQTGTCLHGGHGEDATGYEPRPADWKPPAPPETADNDPFIHGFGGV